MDTRQHWPRKTGLRNFIPWTVALADVLAVPSYMVDVEPFVGQSVGLALKLLLLPLLLRNESFIIKKLGSFLILAAVCLFSLTFAPDTRWNDVIAVLGFLSHLGLTLALVREEFSVYLRAISYLIGISAIFYILFVIIGQIPIINGRHFYFNGLHPNLGAEIVGAAALCASISLPYIRFLPLALLFLANAVIMEGRAALLTIAFALVLRTAHEIFVGSDSRKVQLRVILATPLAMIAGVKVMPYLVDAMLLDNPYRGLGTGLVGRTDRWMVAWGAFLEKPIIGQGIGWLERSEHLGAHNFFLYGLAEMGLVSIILFVMLARMAVLAYRLHGWKVVSLSPVLVMFVLNDRFINLNPYPFLVWVMFFALSARSVSSTLRTPTKEGRVRFTNALGQFRRA